MVPQHPPEMTAHPAEEHIHTYALSRRFSISREEASRRAGYTPHLFFRFEEFRGEGEGGRLYPTGQGGILSQGLEMQSKHILCFLCKLL